MLKSDCYFVNIGKYMKDPKNQAIIDRLHPIFRPIAVNFIEEIEKDFGVTIHIDSGYRSFTEQQGIYNQGRSKPGKIISWAKPGSSWHNYGLAIDICPWAADHSKLDWNYDFSKWRACAEKYRLTWGGNFPKGKIDEDHYEYKAGYTIKQLLQKHIAGDFIPGTEYVKL